MPKKKSAGEKAPQKTDDTASGPDDGVDALAAQITGLDIGAVHMTRPYYGTGTLRDLRELCGDLDLPNDLPSKTQCRWALNKVHVNITQFLECKNRPGDVLFFPSYTALCRYTAGTGQYFSRKLAKKSPLKYLLKKMQK